MTIKSLFAPAKINLYLHVIGERGDGYRLLDSLVVFADTIGDNISVKPASNIELILKGKYADKLLNQDNIVIKAAKILRQRFKIEQGAEITIEKNLPIASGIGGGSSDAASVLKLLIDLWGIKDKKQEIAQIALQLGADIPACLHANPLYMGGIGEQIQECEIEEDLYILLTSPGKSLATAEVFAARSGDFSTPPTRHKKFTSTTQLIELLKQTSNDLQQAAISIIPEIADLISNLEKQEGCLLARMSGSGATCFGIFNNKQNLQNAQNNLKLENPNMWVEISSIRK
ncbi:MAG: 4-(cytidine 5'-diphospho)-2-C-methyl-D-erythritol kinase [Pseudomonadota bacterium]